MIEGSRLRPIWTGSGPTPSSRRAAGPDFRDRLPVADRGEAIKYLSYIIDNTSKSRAIFEINKGVNVNPQTTSTPAWTNRSAACRCAT